MVRGFLLALWPVLACGQSLEDAAGALARKVASHLAPGETAQVTSRSLILPAGGEIAKAQAAVERALGRPAQNGTPVAVVLTLSENLKGRLLVAEIRHENERAVEMETFRPETEPAPSRPAIRIEKRLVWEQEAPILDVVAMGDQLLVLEPTGVTRYEGRARRESVATPGPAIRDPRGRMEIKDDALTVYLPTGTCRGTWRPGLALRCEPGPAEFKMGEYSVRFSAGRNMLEGAGWPPPGFENRDGDIASFSSACTEGRVMASGTGDRDSADSVALYEVVKRLPVQAGERVEFSGPVTALWPSAGGGVAVIRNLSTGRYEAYSLTLDCGR